MTDSIKANVTIVIPIYNGQKFLRDAVQSVINQTYKSWVLYLINDGSNDNSLSIINECVAKDKRIKVLDDGQNKGLIYRLNQSISLCNTKYYARMDADDIMYVNRIEEQFNFLEEHPEVDVCGSSIMTIDDNNNIIGSGLNEGEVESFIHPTVMGRSEWFKENPYHTWALRAEDTELWYRTFYKSNFVAIGRPLLFYREFGVPTFDKYYQSSKTLLKIFANYREYNKSFKWCVMNYVLTLIKIVLYFLFSLFNNTDYLVSKRHRVPVPKELQLGARELASCIE